MVRAVDRALTPPDTTREAAAVQRAAQARLTPEERVRLAVQMSEDVRAIMLEGLRARNPDASDAQLRRMMLRRIYGDVWNRLPPQP
jgi:hypothetical protein